MILFEVYIYFLFFKFTVKLQVQPSDEDLSIVSIVITSYTKVYIIRTYYASIIHNWRRV